MIENYTVYIDLLGNGEQLECYVICSPESYRSTVQFVRKRLRDMKRKACWPNARVVVSPTYKDDA